MPATILPFSKPQTRILWRGKYYQKGVCFKIFFYLRLNEKIDVHGSYTVFRRISRRRKRIEEMQVSGKNIYCAVIVKSANFNARLNGKDVFFCSSDGVYSLNARYMAFPADESGGTGPYPVKGRDLTRVTPRIPIPS